LICNNRVLSAADNGEAAGAGVDLSGVRFDLEGGTIRNNEAIATGADGKAFGGGVNSENASMTFVDGCISENAVSASGTGGSAFGAGVRAGKDFLDMPSHLNISGNLYIMGNTITEGNRSGNLYLENDHVVDISNPLSTSARIGVTLQTQPQRGDAPTEFTSGFTGNGLATNFFSDDEHRMVLVDSGEAALAWERFAVTVTNGVGDGIYETGGTVTITAVPPEGKYFTEWTTNDAITLADATATTTTFTMIGAPVTVVANMVDKEAPVFTTRPAAITGLTYNGNAQALITAGTVTGGTLSYAVVTGGAAAPTASAYGAVIPTASAAGTYDVYYRVTGDATHLDVAPQKISVTIAEPDDDDEPDDEPDVIRTPSEQEIIDLYALILGRIPDEDGYLSWLQGLTDHSMSMANVLRGFFLSEEFTDRHLSNEEIVALLYLSTLGREGSEEEIVAWAEKLEDGEDLEDVLSGFLLSEESEQYFDDLGLDAGGIYPDGTILPAGLRAYVARMYHIALGRAPEVDGFYGWMELIYFGRIMDDAQESAKDEAIARLMNAGKLDPRDLPSNFFFSPEYVNRNRSDEEYITDLYLTILDRAPEEAGMEHWLEELQTKSREDILELFVISQEFTNLLETFDL
jgi:hypothetical protein